MWVEELVHTFSAYRDVRTENQGGTNPHLEGKGFSVKVMIGNMRGMSSPESSFVDAKTPGWRRHLSMDFQLCKMFKTHHPHGHRPILTRKWRRFRRSSPHLHWIDCDVRRW